MQTRFRARSIVLLVSVALATTVLSGCSVISNLSAGAGDGPEDDVFSIKAGDCFDDAPSTSDDSDYVSGILSVPCSEPHDNEAYFVFNIDADEYPGEDAVTSEADTTCTAEFEAFVGLLYDDSELYETFFFPTEESWADGDKEVVCVVYEDGVKTTGSLEGANR